MSDGELGGHEGVKLEEMVRIIESGSELAGIFPLEQHLLVEDAAGLSVGDDLVACAGR